MFKFSLSIGEAHIFSTKNDYYFDDFVKLVLMALNQCGDDKSKIINYFKGLAEFIYAGPISPTAIDYTTVPAYENTKVMKYLPEQKMLFFSDGKYEMLFDRNHKIMSVGVLNDSNRQLRIIKDANTMHKVLNLVRETMSKIVHPVEGEKKAAETTTRVNVTKLSQSVNSRSNSAAVKTSMSISPNVTGQSTVKPVAPVTTHVPADLSAADGVLNEIIQSQNFVPEADTAKA